MIRKKTRQIIMGGLRIGGSAPVSIQSMVDIDTKDISSVTRQIKMLEKAGCEIIRVSVKDESSARAISKIKKFISIPLEADVHFDYRLAVLAAESGADGIRINPGNITKAAHIKEIIKECKKQNTPIRIGVNSGSLPRLYARYGKGNKQSDAMVACALDCLKIFKKERFYNIMISLKSSDVMSTISAYRKISMACDFPLHLGVTATGCGQEAVIKSAVGIGSLLSEGIGDTIRVSLTAHPRHEIKVARQILQALGIRRFYHEVISCPTCGRCQVDLEKIVRQVKKKLPDLPNPAGLPLAGYTKPYPAPASSVFKSKPYRVANPGNSAICAKGTLTIAIMGCEVNGPGEARDADIGIAFGKDSGILFKKGRIIKKVSAKNAVVELLREL
jgi:(E)-4-hydroxy-3-methylbut-2-enyl-diphosphate synthase